MRQPLIFIVERRGQKSTITYRHTRKVVEVPRETVPSRGRRGKARIIDGFSPVEGAIAVDALNP